ncbi:hypothetical protein IP92_05542 [Pseudoduganella flava]|uniref:Lipoprotein n=1 Tax=Pseudoduganella flava TaxID=871742 RepID=A0A562PD60_9BURK|nr:hypothetical protein [Pseudoduganella flava]QGZ40101.1 hypothetical protein GO485_14210 [Pseudoduganella flava]TWI42150.1 hypothetical protein IP92_05542 [Pseudoduganella flava]
MTAPPRRRWPRWLTLGAPAACAGCLLWCRRGRHWAVYETAPSRVTAGQFASVLLRMAVRGGHATAPAGRRYRRPVLLLGVDGLPWRTVGPARLTCTGADLVCRFDFMVPDGAHVLAYRFRFVFDGATCDVAGRKAIAVRPKSTRPDLAGPALMRAMR